MGWRQWSQTQYDKWGSKLQGKYNEIKAMKFSPEVTAVLKALSTVISAKLVVKFLKIIEKTYKPITKEAYENKVKAVLEAIKDKIDF